MMIPEKFSRKQVVISSMLALFVGAAAASVFWFYHNRETLKNLSDNIKPFRQQNNPYAYINPLLGYEVPSDVKEFNEYQPLAKKINSSLAAANDSNLSGYSVYFRDLSLGRWVGVNQDVPYSPGSMMKVGVMVAYFKEAETNPDILQQKYQYASSTADEINGVPFSSPSGLTVGQSYTVEHLIEAMIINSDNGAKDVLINHIDPTSFIEVHTDLGLPNPVNTQNYTITAKQYSILMRVLYNATYLSREYSEKAMEILTKADYKDGLVAGVPKSTRVGQKYGEAIDNSDPQNPLIDLSDCGVVYHPTHPYILCIMTKGKNAADQAKTIAAISQIVWNEVESYSKK